MREFKPDERIETSFDLRELIERTTFCPGSDIGVRADAAGISIFISLKSQDSTRELGETTRVQQYFRIELPATVRDVFYQLRGFISRLKNHETDEWLALDGYRVENPHPEIHGYAIGPVPYAQSRLRLRQKEAERRKEVREWAEESQSGTRYALIDPEELLRRPKEIRDITFERSDER